MAIARMLHKKISVSLQVNNMPIEDQLLFTWMIPHADDDGRLHGEANYIRSIVIPFKKWTDKDVQEILINIAENGLIYYWQDRRGLKYIEFPKWLGHQKIAKIKYKPSELPAFTGEGLLAKPTM